MYRSFSVACAVVLLGCSATEHNVVISFDPPSLAADTDRIELTLVKSCRDQNVAGAALPVQPQARVELERGRLTGLGEVEAKVYGLYAVAISEGCRFAAACKNVDLAGNSKNLLITIEPVERPICVTPPDAGTEDDGGTPEPDAGPPIDSGGFTAGTELALSFDHPDGEIVIVDESDNSYLGTLGFGATINENGRTGSGLYLPGNSAVLEFEPILPFTEKITVEAWVRPELYGGWATIINRYLGSTGYWLGTTQDGLGFAFWVDLTFAAQLGEVELETWTHLAGTFDAESGQVLLYVNGVEAASALHPSPAGVASTPLSIGNKPSTIASNDLRPFTGGIDEVRIFESVREPQLICLDAGGTWNGGVCTPAQTEAR